MWLDGEVARNREIRSADSTDPTRRAAARPVPSRHVTTADIDRRRARRLARPTACHRPTTSDDPDNRISTARDAHYTGNGTGNGTGTGSCS